MPNALPSNPDPVLLPLSGSPLESERLQAVLKAYAPILEEIERLRTLDLREVHPAVIYDPTAPYRLAT